MPEPVPCDELTGLDTFHINRCGEGYYSLKALVSGSSNVREVPGYKQNFSQDSSCFFPSFLSFPPSGKSDEIISCCDK